MPIWSGISQEIALLRDKGDKSAQDTVRRSYLQKLHDYTGRNVILYAVPFTLGVPYPPGVMQVSNEDIQGLMEVVHGLPKEPTDLIIHSPGGSSEAAEGIVMYLHEQYPSIRAIVPQMAMSAATMIACGAEQIVMGKHSNLGPIDPQVAVGPGQYAPAQAIIDQFEMAIKKSVQPGLEAWGAMLRVYAPALIVCCREQIDLSKMLVRKWLRRWMFAGDKDGARKARKIANFLASHKTHLTHARHIFRDQLTGLDMNICKLEKDSQLQDLVLSVFHATTLTFMHSSAVKIIENHQGKAYVTMIQMPGFSPPAPSSPKVPNPPQSPT